jgi:hypothetical protein
MSVRDYPVQPNRFGYVVVNDDNAGPDHYLLIRDCPFCKEEARVMVPAQGLWDWEHGALIQRAMPDLTSDEREMVMTGTHKACWDEFMKDDEDEDSHE